MSSEKADAGVYGLVTCLCSNIASTYNLQEKTSRKKLSSKMRTHAFEIILRKSQTQLPDHKSDPITDLYSYYYKVNEQTKNVGNYKKSLELKNIIKDIKQTDFGDRKELFFNVLKVLVTLSSTDDNNSNSMYQNPFTYGLLDQMLPRPKRADFGSVDPYPYYPAHVFELPFSLRCGSAQDTTPHSYSEYVVETFDSNLLLPEACSSQQPGGVEVKTFLSPMSLASMTSSRASRYTGDFSLNFPRLTEPRDLQIPSAQTSQANVKVSLASGCTKADVKEVYRAKSQGASVEIWEMASQINKDVTTIEIWDAASKIQTVNERQLIANSTREMALWKQAYGGVESRMNVISEKQLIRHIMYLLIGIETKSFYFDKKHKKFRMRENLIIECVSLPLFKEYVTDMLEFGTLYKRLYDFAFNHDKYLNDTMKMGLVYEASRDAVRRYLIGFRLRSTAIFDDSLQGNGESTQPMPTLLQILHHVQLLYSELVTMAIIFKLRKQDMYQSNKQSLPMGGELMSYLFKKISPVTHREASLAAFNLLFSVCKVYFKFIERFIFKGELDDRFSEFFIKEDSTYIDSKSKKYWDNGFYLSYLQSVPNFLKGMARCILLCGKSLRLFKMCNPADPLVLLISSDHPSVKCCSSFEELQRQQQILDVYRTRCLFVSGERVTFEQILLKKDAERKAFAEMATLKQAETMEKIVAERKRLAQLIIAEKQHSLRVLEAAMMEAKTNKNRRRQKEKLVQHLEREADKTAEVVDSAIIDSERNKIMEYYSKLNMEVEKSKIHTEWKVKRLQLDQNRILLLSTEERNLKREKFELEHPQSENIMAMSVQSDHFLDAKSTQTSEKMSVSTESFKMLESSCIPIILASEFTLNKTAAQSSDILNILPVDSNTTSKDDQKYFDNTRYLDTQGNIVGSDKDMNSNKASETSSGIIGGSLDSEYDNIQYLQSRQDALVYKKKVMMQEFGSTDNDNNITTNVQVTDEENNLTDMTPFAEAKRNKLKVLSAECEAKKPEIVVLHEPRTDAQKEALANKRKVLGVEYNLPAELQYKREPANTAQEEALVNRRRVLDSEYEGTPVNEGFKEGQGTAKRCGLTLNLKPSSESMPLSGMYPVTPSTGAFTPAEFFPRLDIETPTTAEPLSFGRDTTDLETPNDSSDSISRIKFKRNDKEITSGGFHFALLEDDIVDSETATDSNIGGSPYNSPSKSTGSYPMKRSILNILEGTYSLEDFDPFGLKSMRTCSIDNLSSKMDLDAGSSCYAHPAVLFEEMQKKPYKNIFVFSDEECESQITCDNIATLTACLQRSVLLPLTYQLEVVNNAIVAHFLVNLDMYEHLRSLKDYFFLMDGEFSRGVCRNLFARLGNTINPQELLNFATLQNILDKALGSSISHIHKCSDNLSFTLGEAPLSFQHSSPDVLACLSLTYTVEWPLNIIMSNEALQRYAKVFQFLLKMRRISYVLGEDFEYLKQTVKVNRERAIKLQRSPQYLSLQTYRHVMASLTRALDNYIVTTCILNSWTEFENDLKKARTLDDLYECHVVYVKKVLFRCLLNNRSTPVMKLLNDIFTVILKFSRVLMAGEWSQQENGYFTHQSFPQLEELFHLFEKLAKYLHKVITRLMECGYQRHLVELLTMINLNGYYEPKHDTTQNSTQLSHDATVNESVKNSS